MGPLVINSINFARLTQRGEQSHRGRGGAAVAVAAVVCACVHARPPAQSAAFRTDTCAHGETNGERGGGRKKIKPGGVFDRGSGRPVGTRERRRDSEFQPQSHLGAHNGLVCNPPPNSPTSHPPPSRPLNPTPLEPAPVPSPFRHKISMTGQWRLRLH